MEESIVSELKKYTEYIAERDKIRFKIIVKNLESDNPSINGSNFKINGDIKPGGYMENYAEEDIIFRNDEILRLEKELKEIEARITMIDSILKTLKPFCQELIKSKYFYGLTEEEIARDKQRSKKSIHRTIKNSINKMNKLYLK